MSTQEILLPLFVEVILTFLLWVWHGGFAHARFLNRRRAAGEYRVARAQLAATDPPIRLFVLQSV